MAEKKPTPKKKTTSTPKKRVSSAAGKPYKSTKPLLGSGTVVVLVLFVAIIIFAVYVNRKKQTDAAAATPTSGGALVFTEQDGTPTSIKVEPAEGEAIQLDLNDKKAWELTLPTKTEANQGAAEAAVTQLSALDIVNPEIKGNTADFGLDKPAYIISIKFASGKSHTLEIGDSAVTNNGYYARLDKGNIMLVSLSGIDALTQMVASPPYLNTPIPTALPATETPVPAADTLTAPVEVTVTSTP